MKNLIRLLRHGKPYWGLLYLTAFSLLAVTGLNLLGPWLIRSLIDILTDTEVQPSLYAIRNIALTLALIYLLRAIFTYMYRYYSHVAAWNLVSDMRVIVYNHLQKLSLRYYHDKQTGQLMSRTVNDTATFEVLIAHAVPDLVTNGFILVGITVILFMINPVLAALTLIPVPFLLVGSILFTKKILPNFRRAQTTLADLNAILQDNISGVKEIQVFNQQKREAKKVEKHAKNYASAILQALRLSALFHPSIEMFSALGTVIVVGFGGWLAINHHLSVADMVGFLLYLSLFYQPIATLARVSEDLQQATAGAERVFEVLDTEPDIQDSKHAIDIEDVKGEITFSNVDFHYIPSTKVLNHVSFTAKPGQMIALVGPTGVGKTTIISLISRFYDPTAGQILLDGHNLKDITLTSLRNQISIVLQDIFLFNGTVADNIAYGCKGSTLEEVIASAKIARAHSFISELPEGYDTVIGERGVKLSGGQKQRLSIARAILRNTPILIFDEATASVDVETEAQIQQAIQELSGTRTIVIIAHRLSTVKRADNILVLETGSVVEAGTHEALLKNNGLYAKLCNVQFQSQ